MNRVSSHRAAARSLAGVGLLLGLCVATGMTRGAEHAEKDVLAAIKKLGGTARHVSGESKDWQVEFHLRGQSLTDDGLRHVAALRNVVRLNLRDTQITGAGLAYIKSLTSLRRLHLERTGIGDDGTEHLATLVNLEYLNLYGTKITDKTLEHLASLKKLKSLYVWETGVTDEGVARLQAALPDLKIVRGVDLSKLPKYVPHKEEPLDIKADLKWIATNNREDAPKSLNGINTTVLFDNQSKQRIKVYWVSYGNDLMLYGELEPGKTRRQNTYANNSWLITDASDNPLGYFIAVPEVARAVIPEQK